MFETLFEIFYKAIIYTILEIGFEFIFYYIGWPFVKIFTFGKYPKGTDKWSRDAVGDFFTSMLGLLIVVGVLVFLYS